MPSPKVSTEEWNKYLHTLLHINKGEIEDDLTFHHLFYLLGLVKQVPDLGPFERLGMWIHSREISLLLRDIKSGDNPEFQATRIKGPNGFAIYKYSSAFDWKPDKDIDPFFGAFVLHYLKAEELASRLATLAVHYTCTRLAPDPENPWTWILTAFGEFDIKDGVEKAKQLYRTLSPLYVQFPMLQLS